MFYWGCTVKSNFSKNGNEYHPAKVPDIVHKKKNKKNNSNKKNL